MLRLHQYIQICSSCTKSVLPEASCNVRCFNGAVHQFCRNLSTGKDIDAASLNDTDKIKKTCLYEFHVSRGGKMVDFAGYHLPIQYSSQGIAASHKHTR